MIKKDWSFLFLIWALTMMVSCDSSRIFDQFQEIPNSGWHKDSAVQFRISVSDTIHRHNLHVKIRNDIDYLYSNLWLFIDLTEPGKSTVTDTFEIMLAEPSGNWLGKGFGGLKTLGKEYKQNIRFPVSGEYVIDIRHGMREETLKGIRDIGVRLEEAE